MLTKAKNILHSVLSTKLNGHFDPLIVTVHCGQFPCKTAEFNGPATLFLNEDLHGITVASLGIREGLERNANILLTTQANHLHASRGKFVCTQRSMVWSYLHSPYTGKL